MSSYSRATILHYIKPQFSSFCPSLLHYFLWEIKVICTYPTCEGLKYVFTKDVRITLLHIHVLW